MMKPLVPEWVRQERRRRRWQRKAGEAGLKLTVRDVYLDLERGDEVLRISSGHGVYVPHIIENFEYYLNSVVALRAGGKVLVDMSGPRYHRLQGFADLPFLFPSHTEPYGTTAEYLDFADLKGGEIVLDIGAYSGVTSIIFGERVGSEGRVYGLEADRGNFECAEVNVELARRWMGLENITLVNKAIWSHDEGVLFSEEGAMGSSAVEITGGGRGREYRVPSMTLAGFCRSQGLDRVDFIKVDVEGCEVVLLEDSVEFLSSLKARMIVEPHMREGKSTRDRCCELLQAAGYTVRVRECVGESQPLIEAVKH